MPRVRFSLTSTTRAVLLAAALAVGAITGSPASAQFSQETLLVQRTLIEQGYSPGIVDGFYGNLTKTAIQQFQRDWQIPQTGAITPELVKLLTEPPAKEIPLEGHENCFILSPAARPQETARWTGECVANRPTGSGTLTWTFVRQGETRTETLTGEMDLGQVSGEAEFVSHTGARYKGEWFEGKPHGNGRLQNARGDVYVGEWLNGVPHGQGKWVSAFGDEFEGAWKNGLPVHLSNEQI